MVLSLLSYSYLTSGQMTVPPSSTLYVTQPTSRYLKEIENIENDLERERQRNDSLVLVLTKMAQQVKFLQENANLSDDEIALVEILQKDLETLQTKQDSTTISQRKELEKRSFRIIGLLKEIEEARIKRLEGFRLIDYLISLKIGELTLVFGVLSAFAFAFYRLGNWVRSIKFDIEKSGLYHENRRLIDLIENQSYDNDQKDNSKNDYSNKSSMILKALGLIAATKIIKEIIVKILRS